MKLISMTDFVLEQNSTDLKPLMATNWTKEFELRFKKIVDYANFLKKPLTLGMFVPCDDDGNVLELEKKMISIDDEQEMKKYNAYHNAKSKVLFNNCLIQDIADNNFLISNGSVTFWIYSKEPKTIDELTSYDFDLAVSF